MKNYYHSALENVLMSVRSKIFPSAKSTDSTILKIESNGPSNRINSGDDNTNNEFDKQFQLPNICEFGTPPSSSSFFPIPIPISIDVINLDKENDKEAGSHSESETGSKTPLSLFECLKPLLFFGGIVFILSFSINHSNKKYEDEKRSASGGEIGRKSGESKMKKKWIKMVESPSGFIFTSSQWRRALVLVIKIIVGIYLLVLVIRERDKLKQIKLMDSIWKITFFFFSFFVVTILVTLEVNRETWIEIFELSQGIHGKFKMMNIPIKLYHFQKIVTVLCIFHFCLGVPHIMLVRAQNHRNPALWPADENSSYTEFETALNTTTHFSTTAVTFILDFIAWTTWHFADTLRISLALYIWLLYFNLHQGINDLNMNSNQLLEVMNLHLKISNLLRTINCILSPITFIGCTFFVFYSCFYVNYLFWGFGSVARQMLFVHFIIKNISIFLISADVNSKAHNISEWLEKICSTEENLSFDSSVNANKLIIFTAQVYSRDAIGFRGFQFFVISTSFITALLSLILTYTVVITQFSGMFGQNENEIEVTSS